VAEQITGAISFNFMQQSKTKTSGAAPMQAADSTRSIRAAQILRAHGYRQGASHQVKGSRLDFYAGPRGNVIVQVWPEGNGVTMYADWPLGMTWEQTELALVRGGLAPEARKFAPVADDRNPIAALLSTLSTWREAGGDAIHLSTLAQDWPDETATLEDLIILATEAQKDGWQFAPLQTESNALIEKIARMTPYSDGTPQSDGIAPDGEDAMRVLNHLIASARALVSGAKANVRPDFSSRAIYHLTQLVEAAGKVEKNWQAGDLAAAVRNLMGERDDAAALLERIEKGGAL
jgi:hypothetical protein